MKKVIFTIAAILCTFKIYAQEVIETVSSGTSGDAILRIESDTDNSNESDNPRIEILQDGGGLGAYIGFNADWGGSFVQPDNLFRIGTRWGNVDNFNRLVINGQNGNVGIGTDNPNTLLDVNGKISWGSNGAQLNIDQGAAIELRGTGVCRTWISQMTLQLILI